MSVWVNVIGDVAVDASSLLTTSCMQDEHKYQLELVEANCLEAEGWDAAVQGCDYVIHTASPVGAPKSSKDEASFIRPAVDGVAHVLNACGRVGGVKRIVQTSSVAAVMIGHPDSRYIEGPAFTAVWSDPRSCFKMFR